MLDHLATNMQIARDFKALKIGQSFKHGGFLQSPSHMTVMLLYSVYQVTLCIVVALWAKSSKEIPTICM